MQLLSTKFHIPEFNISNISRNRISSLLNSDSSIVIISAPAGFGKTTLLSEWVKNCKTKIAWVSLEKSENIPAVFWNYLITSISSVLPDCGQYAIEQIKSSEVSSIENILIDIINEIGEKRTQLSLVLDDYHIITDSDIHKGIEFLIDHLPSNMRIVISGREDPKLSISKLRLSGKLTEIRAEQLRFNIDETQEFLNNIHSLNLNPEDITLLKDKTEGWIAGLALAVLSIKEHEDKKNFINDFTGSHRYIIDYLIEEVLAGLSDEIKDFMLKISILERFCPDLCYKVSENPGYAKILSSMETNNLFLIPLDNHRQWFRYHHLFREFLLKKLLETKPETVKKIHGYAFHWLKDNGCENEAFDHGIKAEKYIESADLLSQKVPTMFSESGGNLLRNYLNCLPDEIVNTNPDLCCYNVWSNILSGNFDSIALLFQDIFKNNKTVAGFISIIKSYQYFYQTAEFEKSVMEMKTALKILPEKHTAIREMGELVLCLSLRYNGDIESAFNYISKITIGEDIPILVAMNYADILLGMGKINSALSLIDKSIKSGKIKYGDNLLSEYGYMHMLKGSILREKNEIAEAVRVSKKGMYLGRNNEYIEFVFIGNMEYARVLAADNNFEESEKAINRSLEATRSSSTWGEFIVIAYQARIEISKGNINNAERLLKKIGDFSSQVIPYFRHCEYLTYCRLCIAGKQTKRVHEITDFMINEDINSKRMARLLECYILKAIAFHIDKKPEKALTTLGKAFKLSEEDGYIRIFLDEGENITELFKEASKKNILPDYLKPYIKTTSRTAINESRTIIINEFKENFNEREIEILKLMKKGSSNKIIADTLFISVNTVRWYASRIFAKLDVKRRGEAVSHAEKYELI